MQKYHDDILHYDAILTMSAKLAASTGDVLWIGEYRTAEIRLLDAVRGVIDFSGSDDVRRRARGIDDANIKLIDMANESFDFVDSGRLDQATALLKSTEYENLKSTYSLGVEELLKSIRANTDQRVDDQVSKFKRLIWFVLGVLVLLLTVWASVIRSLRSWRRELVMSQSRKAEAEFEITRINQELEQRIEVRTSELQESERQYQSLAYFDDLTGLPNRRSGMEFLSQSLRGLDANIKKISVMLIDLDDFKRVNDSLGHAIGDKLLIQAAQRIQHSLDFEDKVYRLGGDEFLVVVTNVLSEKTAHSDSDIARKMISAFEEPFSLGDGRVELLISPSIGVAVAPDHGDNVDDLIRHADIAMYSAKYSGRNRYHLFDEEMNKRAQARLNMESKLSSALEREQFSLHYQPQIDLQSGKVIGVEALLRWELPDAGFVSPAEFIPLAEETGLIMDIGEWVLNQACSQLKLWSERYQSDMVVAVNVSPLQLRQPRFFDDVMKAIRLNDLQTNRLELELTETALLEDAESVKQTLLRLSEAGVRLSLDDFGTGYSALSYLKRYNFDNLKIDRSYVSVMQETERDAQLVQSIISLAHGLDMKIVGEGTETLDQCDILKSYGCDIAQGYYYSKPLPPVELIDFVKSWKSNSLAIAS